MTDQTQYQNVTFPSNGGTAHGYLAGPDRGQGPALIVIQEWWGLTDHIADVTNRFAREGFMALAPDLYGGRTTHDAGEAAALMNELPPEKAVTELSGGQDAFTPAEQARAVLGTVSGPVDVQVYDAGHAFFNDENLLGTYDQDRAGQAWARTVDFLRQHLAG